MGVEAEQSILDNSDEDVFAYRKTITMNDISLYKLALAQDPKLATAERLKDLMIE